MRPYLLGIAGAAPVLVFSGAILYHRWRRDARGTHLPFTDKLLRPAGYTLSRDVESLGEDVMAWLFIAYLASLASVGALRFTPSDLLGQWLLLIVFGALAAFFTIVAWNKWLKLRRLKLGLLGEQAVGEQLQLLAPNGYRIFHDLPSDQKWNIDHVIVGPAGVFAIETKCFTKQPTISGKPDYQAEFDGTKISLPTRKDFKTPEQAKRNAKWLAEMLSKAVGEPVNVKPIVALPGWYVLPLEQQWDVRVLSGKMVPFAFANEPRILSDKLIQQVAYQLDQRCRTVQF